MTLGPKRDAMPERHPVKAVKSATARMAREVAIEPGGHEILLAQFHALLAAFAEIGPKQPVSQPQSVHVPMLRGLFKEIRKLIGLDPRVREQTAALLAALHAQDGRASAVDGFSTRAAALVEHFGDMATASIVDPAQSASLPTPMLNAAVTMPRANSATRLDRELALSGYSPVQRVTKASRTRKRSAPRN